jgi:pimeloyl-ACP methyl ester carboxylesterase
MKLRMQSTIGILGLAISVFLPATMAAAQQASTVVIVHGAFQDASAWQDLASRLTASGRKVVTVNLPGRGGDTTSIEQISLDAHRDAVLKAVNAEAAPVTLIGHSFGGITISAVAEAAPTKIKTLVYVAAYLPRSGDSLQGLSGDDKTNKFSKENFVLSPDYKYASVLERDRALIFCNDCSDAMKASVAQAMVREPLAPMATPVALTSVRFGTVNKVYIRTGRDQALSPEMQDLMLSWTPVAQVTRIDTSHVPFLTKPDELAKILSGL